LTVLNPILPVNDDRMCSAYIAVIFRQRKDILHFFSKFL
jgi:hypothetical protein